MYVLVCMHTYMHTYVCTYVKINGLVCIANLQLGAVNKTQYYHDTYVRQTFFFV